MRWHLQRALIRVLSNDTIAHAIELSQRRPRVWGDPARLHIDPTASVENTTFNVNSGRIAIGAHSFFGQDVLVATGTHDYRKRGTERHAFPADGRDVIIGEGVWIASRAVILGPCVVGDHAVVAAGAVVTSDVAPDTIVAGVPARPIGTID